MWCYPYRSAQRGNPEPKRSGGPSAIRPRRPILARRCRDFALRWPDEMRLGCEPVLNGMQAILAQAQARDRESRPREADSIRFGRGNSKPLSVECLGGEVFPKHTSLGIVGHAPGRTLMLESRANPSSGEMMADARSATRGLANCADTSARTLLGRDVH